MIELFNGKMMPTMIARASKQLKIINSIIVFYAVNVMNNFFRVKVTAKMFFHCKAMFENVSIVSRMGVRRLPDKNIASHCFCSSSMPASIIWPNIFTFQRNACLMTSYFTFRDFAEASLRTEFPSTQLNIARLNHDFFSASMASFLNPISFAHATAFIRAVFSLSSLNITRFSEEFFAAILARADSFHVYKYSTNGACIQ